MADVKPVQEMKLKSTVTVLSSFSTILDILNILDIFENEKILSLRIATE